MPQILQNHYVLAVHDIKKSAGFFVDGLGFQVTAEPNSPNKISPPELREWCAEYLSDYSSEVANFPEGADSEHWNLNMADYDPGREAVFVAYAFSQGSVFFCSGLGNAHDVRQFCEHEFEAEASDLMDALKSSFRVPYPVVSAPWHVLESWLEEGGRPKSSGAA